MHKELIALAHRGGLWTRPSLRRAGFSDHMISEAIRSNLLEAKLVGTYEVSPKRFRVMENEQMNPGDTVMRVVNGELKQFQVVGEPNGGKVSLVDPEDPNARVQQVNQNDTAEPVPGAPGVPLEPGQPVPPQGTIPEIRPQHESRLLGLLEGKPWENEEEEKPDGEGEEPKPPVTESEVPVGEPPAANDVAGLLAQRMAGAYKDWESGRAASPSADDWVITLGELVGKPDIMRYGGEDLSDFVYDLLNDGSTIKRAARLLYRRYQQRHPKLESKSLAERLLGSLNESVSLDAIVQALTAAGFTEIFPEGDRVHADGEFTDTGIQATFIPLSNGEVRLIVPGYKHDLEAGEAPLPEIIEIAKSLDSAWFEEYDESDPDFDDEPDYDLEEGFGRGGFRRDSQFGRGRGTGQPDPGQPRPQPAL